MSNETWKCSCGTENSGKTCASCGKPKTDQKPVTKVNEYSEEYLRLQIRQQELLNEQEERRIAKEEEQARKTREYNDKMKEYNDKIAQVAPTLLRRWAGSWIVLTLAILASVALACSLGSFFSNLKSTVFSIIVSAVKPLLNCLVCVGFWRSYLMARKKDSPLNSRGVRMLGGVVKFYQVIVDVLCILVLALFILIFIGMKSCADGVTEEAGSAGLDLNGVNKALTGTLIGILVALVMVFVVIIVFFFSVNKFSKQVVAAIDSKTIYTSSTSALMVFFFIIGGITLIGAIGNILASNTIVELLGKIGKVGDKMLSSGLFGNKDIANMLSQLANAGMFIFGGILALKFSALSGEALRQKQAIEVPTME